MSNVILAEGWKGLRREAVAGWAALTGGAILFALIAAAVSRLGAGRDAAMAIALLVTAPVAVGSLIWLANAGAAKQGLRSFWEGVLEDRGVGFVHDSKPLDQVRLLAATRGLEQQEMWIFWSVMVAGEHKAAEAACLSVKETHVIYCRAVEKIKSSLDEVPAA